MTAYAARLGWICRAVLVSALLVLGGCGSSAPDTAMPTNPPNPADGDGPNPEQLVSTTGTVVFMEMEGGFWGIVAADSTRYDPGSTLPDSLQTDGLAIRFRGEEQPGRPSMRMWGTPIDLLEAMPVDTAE